MIAIENVRLFTEYGGLMSFGANFSDLVRRAARHRGAAVAWTGHHARAGAGRRVLSVTVENFIRAETKANSAFR